MIRNIKKQKWLGLAAAQSLFIGLILAFAELLEEVREGSTLIVDEKILRTINSSSTTALNTFYLGVTELGGFLLIALATACLITVLVRQKRNYLATFVLLAVAGAGIINIALKTFIGRQRPGLWEQLATESSYSFPSGHAMGSSILALCFVFVFWETKYRLAFMLVGMVYIVLVGFSRLYLGVHYPSDILAGWIVSSAWFMTVGAILYGHSWRTKRIKGVITKND